MHGHYAHIEVCKGRAGYGYMGFKFKTVIAIRNYVKNKAILSLK